MEYKFEPDLSNFDIVPFLNEYEKFPCLWNKSHIDFKDKIARNGAEQHLMQVTGVTNAIALRKKIRSVRGTYNNELRKIKASKQNGIDAEEYVPKLVWFKIADKFLRPVGETFNANELFLDPPTPTVIDSQIQPKTRKRISKEASLEDDRVSSPSQKIIRDEDTIFGELIANKLSHMDKRTKSIVQYHINNIIFQAEMGILDVTSVNNTATFQLPSNINEYSLSSSHNKLDT